MLYTKKPLSPDSGFSHSYPSSSALTKTPRCKLTDYPTNFRAFLNMRIHGESSPHASG